STTGVFTLEEGKTYRVAVTASMMTEGYVVLKLVEASTDLQPHTNSAIWTDITRTWRESSAGPLEVVFTPTETKEYKIYVSSLNGASKLRGAYSALTIHEL